MTIEELVGRCKASVSLTVNEHRDFYQTIQEYLDEQERFDRGKDIPPEQLAEILATDTCYVLQFYPSTPLGFYIVYGPTLESVLEQAERCFTK